jgi:sec-independent protein translocase protein TatA
MKPMGEMSVAHWMIVIAVVVILFGRGKISGLMGDVAQGIKSFKKGMQEDEPAAAKPEENARDHWRAASKLPESASSQVGVKVSGRSETPTSSSEETK